MLIPELVLQSTVKSLLDLIQQDYSNQTDKTKTILFDLFGFDDNGTKMELGKFNYFDQAVDVFITNESKSRKLSVTLGYNLNREGLPTIHILLPSETESDKGIGEGEGYQDYQIDESNNTYKRNFTNVYSSHYSLMVSSDNSSEAILIYHAIKNLFVAIKDHFELMGLRDPKFGGADLSFNNDIIPPHVFHRNLSVSFFYESTVNELSSQKLIKNISFLGNIIAD